MCTVTLFPKGNKDFILTSNRDEAPQRESLQPQFYRNPTATLLYPQDVTSGGTWIGVSDKNRAVCVLNGGFESHKRQLPYRFSRGLVVTQFLEADHLESLVATYNFKNIEPFTMVLVDWNEGLKFYELVWDGTTAHFKSLPLKPHIWSSSTLYNAEMRAERQDWFQDFLKEEKDNSASILQFHKTAGTDNLHYGAIMDRGIVKTTSITQIVKQDEVLTMAFENLQTEEQSTQTVLLPLALDA